MLLIKNGRVLDPASRTDAALDVLLEGERIAKVDANLSAPDAEILDAKGLIVAPGFIDLHCHLREPGQEMSETIETGTRAEAQHDAQSELPRGMGHVDPGAGLLDRRRVTSEGRSREELSEGF